jgi:hypothetical protein
MAGSQIGIVRNWTIRHFCEASQPRYLLDAPLSKALTRAILSALA